MANRQVVTPTYIAIPANYALAPGSLADAQPGFLVRPYSTSAIQPNSLAWTEQQLAGLEGPNLADLSGADARGFYSVPGVINWDISPSANHGRFNGPQFPDVPPPGWPNVNGGTDNSSEEVLTYLQFPSAGFYTMGVNSDDGFRVSAVLAPRDLGSAVVLGQFDGGRGAADTLFRFLVPKAGIYPFRMIYENGRGGANCEWFTVQANGSYLLVNDPANSVKAWRPQDTIPPVTVAAASPGPNGNGWNNSGVTVTLSAEDAGGLGVQSIAYSLSGAPSGTATRVAGSTASILLAADGITTVSFYASDYAGNQETPKSLTVRIDKTPPTLTWGVPTPAANSYGWNNTPVDIPYTTSDNLSGVASSTPGSPVHFGSEGANQTQTVTVTDVAGNTAAFTSPGVNIDMTPPLITASASPSVLWPPNGKMVPVRVSGMVADALSGVDLSSGAFSVADEYGLVQPTGPVTLQPDASYSFTIPLEARREGQDKDGRRYVITVSARDKAGNAASVPTVVVVPHDQR